MRAAAGSSGSQIPIGRSPPLPVGPSPGTRAGVKKMCEGEHPHQRALSGSTSNIFSLPLKLLKPIHGKKFLATHSFFFYGPSSPITTKVNSYICSLCCLFIFFENIGFRDRVFFDISICFLWWVVLYGTSCVWNAIASLPDPGSG